MALQLESGNRLPIVSLGGNVSAPGQGRVLDINQYNAGSPIIILQDNPNRISAIIQNDGPSVAVIYAPNNSGSIQLVAYGTLQIDRDFPWTGPIMASGTNCLVTVAEVSLRT
jgi:hypothetical protein